MPEAEAIEIVRRLHRAREIVFCASFVGSHPVQQALGDSADTIQALVKALEPFEKAIDDSEEQRDDQIIWEASAAMAITFGDLRRARTELSKLKSQGREG